MALKFDLGYNTPTDWVKAVTAAFVAGLGTLSVAVAENGVSGTELINVITVTLVALGTALGLYSTAQKENEEEIT